MMRLCAFTHHTTLTMQHFTHLPSTRYNKYFSPGFHLTFILAVGDSRPDIALVFVEKALSLLPV